MAGNSAGAGASSLSPGERTALRARWEGIRERIDRAWKGAPTAHRAPAPPVLLAVSKGQSMAKIAALHELGQRDFGENYVQELGEKLAEAARLGLDGVRWHFIGHLQSNKAKALVECGMGSERSGRSLGSGQSLGAVHSVDSLKLAAEIAKRWIAARPNGAPLPIFLEVNISAESSKSGTTPANAPGLAAEVANLAPIALQGLMCIPAAGLPEGELRSAFARLRELERGCRPSTRGMLSMGMSDDFELAIAEGATHVRVGTALFGPRGTG